MLRSRFAPIVGAGLLAAGLLVGTQVQDAVSGSEEVEQLRKIEEAYEYVTRAYVEQVDSSELAEAAIEGMLASLDPHSIYISSDEMRRVRESFEASFDGIGIFYEFVEGREDVDTLVVLQPIVGGPSEEVGLEAGDRIIEIDGENAIGIDPEDVPLKLKGRRGTTVEVTVERPGFRDPLSFSIVRDRIPLNTVAASYMVDDQTGLIKLTRFARTSHEEVTTAIRELRAQGMERLILDLRQNAGGLLDQAYAISDEFLEAGEMIVYTESRHSANERQYRATSGGIYEDDPVIVLIDENSASASEIVAGALQDHDRGYLIGRRSFGKGLVQQQFPMTDGSVLQMTVSRYFTPSGRLIQTPYEVGQDDEAYYEAKRDIREAVEDRLAPDGGAVNASAFGSEVPDSLVFQTDGGRVVYGGGGILPDYIVQPDSLSPALRTIIRSASGKRFDDMFARTEIERRGTAFREEWEGREREFVQDFRLTDADFDRLLSYVASEGTPVVALRPSADGDEVLVRSEAFEARADIEARVRAFIARRLFGANAWFPVVGEIDPAIQEAMRHWSDAITLAQASN
ncbi:S41 family peptidase [Rubrivirga sp.]|uniref:S41 family peptidase n=1 Tax=Rubrivirga sp. TaxID=1885344 RepID=UPI003C72F0F6